MRTTVITTPPSVLALSRTDFKSHARISTTADDTLIDSYLEAAVNHVQHLSNRSFITQTMLTKLDKFPSGDIELLPTPLQSVTSVSYTDSGGDTQVWSSAEYEVDSTSDVARISPKPGYSFPTTGSYLSPVQIVWVSGYGNASDVPEDALQVIRFFTSYFYEQREPVIVGKSVVQIPLGIEALLSHFAVHVI